MIIITGDIHSRKERFSEVFIEEEPSLTENDYVIVCGDFGFIFFNNEPEGIIVDETTKLDLDELGKKPYNILFVDGNHENFHALNKYPEELWNGGRIHRIRKNIIHLMRGQVFTIENKTFFTLGGAYSIDRDVRALNYSYWEEEIPSKEEAEEGRMNLERYNNKVDYILTHQAPPDIITEIFHESIGETELDFLGALKKISNEITFDRWYFGHWHEDRNLGRYRALYFDYDILD